MTDEYASDPAALVAPAEYAREARERAALVLPRLSAVARRALDLAQAEARKADDNHVGTEHIVLGLLAVPHCEAARAMGDVGITRAILVAQRHEEEGPSPPGRIPHTPRANRIIALAGEIAGADERVCTVHLLLGVVAESDEWERSGRAGVFHARDAARAAGTTLDELRQAALVRLPASRASEPPE